jgi:autophagy-related protein 2
MRIRLHQCAINIQLFDGFDWQKTRKTIEDEIKAVRRRLERIRQLLASGQKADESIEHTSSTLFNSIYIGVDQQNDMDTAALLKAIDDELDGLGDDTASQSSWQTMPVPGSTEKRSRVRLRGKRLTRSKRPQIEFSLKGLRAEFDQYAYGAPTAQRIGMNAASFEILDHIKTSTWKKFLTEMKADSRGNVRETDADMLRVEVLVVRPNLPDPGEEIRVKVSFVISAHERLSVLMTRPRYCRYGCMSTRTLWTF